MRTQMVLLAIVAAMATSEPTASHRGILAGVGDLSSALWAGAGPRR